MTSMQLVDLTRKLDPNDIDLLPERLRRFSGNIVPEVHHVRPADEGAEVMCRIFGCTRDDLPDGEGWGDERLTITTHLGTHVDAPLHYGSTCEGRPARTIDQIGLDELFVECVVGFFPMYLAGCSAAPARVVAMLADASA